MKLALASVLVFSLALTVFASQSEQDEKDVSQQDQRSVRAAVDVKQALGSQGGVSRRTRNAGPDKERRKKKGGKKRKAKKGKKRGGKKRASKGKQKKRKAGKGKKRKHRSGKRKRTKGKKKTGKARFKSGNAKGRRLKQGGSRASSTRQGGAVYTGSACEYVSVTRLQASGSGCVHGTKFVIKPGTGTRRQFLNMDGEAIIGFVQQGTKFADCATNGGFKDVTGSINCKEVDGLAAAHLNQTGSGGSATTAGPGGSTTAGRYVLRQNEPTECENIKPDLPNTGESCSSFSKQLSCTFRFPNCPLNNSDPDCPPYQVLFCTSARKWIRLSKACNCPALPSSPVCDILNNITYENECQAFFCANATRVRNVSCSEPLVNQGVIERPTDAANCSAAQAAGDLRPGRICSIPNLVCRAPGLCLSNTKTLSGGHGLPPRICANSFLFCHQDPVTNLTEWVRIREQCTCKQPDAEPVCDSNGIEYPNECEAVVCGGATSANAAFCSDPLKTTTAGTATTAANTTTTASSTTTTAVSTTTTVANTTTTAASTTTTVVSTTTIAANTTTTAANTTTTAANTITTAANTTTITASTTSTVTNTFTALNTTTLILSQ